MRNLVVKPITEKHPLVKADGTGVEDEQAAGVTVVWRPRLTFSSVLLGAGAVVLVGYVVAAGGANAGSGGHEAPPSFVQKFGHGEPAKAFEQCSGKDVEHVDCQPGCICTGDNHWYHQCTPPEGTTKCDMDLAQDALASEQLKISGLNDASGKAAEVVQEAKQKLDKVAGSAAWWRKESEKANKQAGHLGWVHAQAVKLAATDDPPKNPGCADQAGQCGGNGWAGPFCCQEGCSCFAKDAYYSQCTVASGFATCGAAAQVVNKEKAAKAMAEWKVAVAEKEKKAERNILEARDEENANAAYDKAKDEANSADAAVTKQLEVVRKWMEAVTEESTWEVVYRADANVREMPSMQAPIAGKKAYGEILLGRQAGGWLKLSGEKGYVKVAFPDTPILKKVKLAITSTTEAPVSASPDPTPTSTAASPTAVDSGAMQQSADIVGASPSPPIDGTNTKIVRGADDRTAVDLIDLRRLHNGANVSGGSKRSTRN